MKAQMLHLFFLNLQKHIIKMRVLKKKKQKKKNFLLFGDRITISNKECH